MTDLGSLPQILRSLRRINLPLQDKEDAALAAVAAALDYAVRNGQMPTDELAWCCRVAWRIALRAARTRLPCDSHAVLRVAAAPDNDLERRDTGAAVRDAISKLPERLRVVVVMCYLEEKQGKEAARACGVCPATISTRLEEALERLRVELTARGFGPI